MQTHTHVGYRENVAYEHTGKLFGHGLSVLGQVHAANYLDFQRFVGSRYRTLCGKTLGGRSAAEKADGGPAVTCKRCLRAIRRNEKG